jgi:molybdopterin synthase sulfur carrier subunit
MLIRFFAGIRTITGVKEIEWEEPTSTLGELLRLLADTYGAEFRRWVLDGERLGSAVMIVVNGDDVRPRAGLQTRLTPTDVISILPVMAGGVMREAVSVCPVSELDRPQTADRFRFARGNDAPL